jgi:hypothetical protein
VAGRLHRSCPVVMVRSNDLANPSEGHDPEGQRSALEQGLGVVPREVVNAGVAARASAGADNVIGRQPPSRTLTNAEHAAWDLHNPSVRMAAVGVAAGFYLLM